MVLAARGRRALEDEPLPPEVAVRDDAWRTTRSRIQARGVVWQSVAIAVVLTAAALMARRVSV